MSFFARYLIFAAVVARAIGWTQDSPPFSTAIWWLLAIYGVVMVSEPPLTRRWRSFPKIYLLVQTSLVFAMLYRAPILDFLPMLYLSLSYQAVQFFGLRIGLAWIGLYSLSTAAMLLAGLAWRPWIFMLLTNTGTNLFIGTLAYLMQRTERVRQENQRLFGELQQAYNRLKDQAAQAEALASAEERHRLVRELHDSLTQTLFSMNLAVQAAQLAAGQDPSQAAPHLRRLQSLSRSAAGEVRALTGTVTKPVSLDEGLPGALRRLASERQAQDGLQITLEIAGEEAPWLPENVTNHLYHITQEALNNVAKHAGVQQAVVRLDLLNCPPFLEIQDRGRGFSLPEMTGSGGFGLGELAERAREMDWELVIDAVPGQGTRIRVQEKVA